MTQMYVRLPGAPYDQTATRYSVFAASRDQTTQRPTPSPVRTLFQDAAATMAPTRNTRLQAAKKSNRAAFFKLPAELRNDIYRRSLVQEETIFVGFGGSLPSTPPLLQTCTEIRAEASGIFFGENSLDIYVYNLDISQVVYWLDLSPARDELYRNSNLNLSVVTGTVTAKHSRKFRSQLKQESWRNLLIWVKFYCQQRCRRVTHLPTDDVVHPDPYPSIDWAIRVFDKVDELLENDGELTPEDVCLQLESLDRAGALE